MAHDQSLPGWYTVVVMEIAEQLAEVQKKIRAVQAEEAHLVEHRRQVILAARESGMKNREIAQALDVHESHVYRMQRTKQNTTP